MGYVSKDIAIITEPRRITLASMPNFVQFASKPGVKSYYENNVRINVLPLWMDGYYNNTGGRTKGQGGGWLVSRPIDVSAYTGQSFTYKGNSPSPYAFCWFKTATGSLISSFHTAANTFTGVIPAGAKHVYLTSNTSYPGYGVFLIGATDLLNTQAIEEISVINIVEPSGVLHTFHGTDAPENVGGNVFFVSDDQTDTAENLREALLNNPWIAANFNVRIPFVWIGATPHNGDTVNIKSKGTGAEYNLTLSAPNNVGDTAYTITPVNLISKNADSISGEASTAEIELDIYTDPAVFLGQDDRPISNTLIGNYAISLQKTYAGVPIWFELNALFNTYAAYNRPSLTPGWFDAGTIRAYRFVAKKRATNSFSFYQSNAMFVLNGYGKPSENLDLTQYLYGSGVFRLLTNKPLTTYVRGQKAFLNFLFQDPQRGNVSAENYTLTVTYRAYTTTNKYLGTVFKHPITRSSLSIVNTCVLDIDSVLDLYPKAGIIRIALSNSTSLLTNDLEYIIRPECLHQLTQFIFLNRLGGWDAFNFDAAPQDDIKPLIETYSKTLTPRYAEGDSIETVYTTDLEHTITVQGAPVSDDVAEWLKELAASRVVLDGRGNYIIKEDFQLKIGEGTQDMQIPTLKYHYSETYTND